MKKLQKLAGVLLALVMVMGLSVTAFAATGSSTITITGVPTTNHTITAYQIFSGSVSGTTLSNVAWGDGVNASAALTAAQGVAVESSGTTTQPFANCTSAAAVAEELAKYSTDSDVVKAFAKAMSASDVLSTASGSATSGTLDGSTYTYTISDVATGYYLVTDTFTDSTDTKGDAVSAYVLYVAGGTSYIAYKNALPTPTKEITNPTTSNVYGTSASADGTVSFKITGTIPSYAADYTTYTYKFHDTMSSNLKDATNFVVSASTSGTLTVTTNYTVDIDSSGKNITIEILNAKTYAGQTITVTYDATLDAGAVAGTAEENKVYIEYSNNPNGSGTGNTVDKKVYVYTFDLTVNKVNESNVPLDGAGFTLYENAGNITEFANGVTYYTYDSTKNEMSTVSTYVAETTYYTLAKAETKVVLNNGKYTATFNDLGEGNYFLVESTTPAGYNTVTPITFSITATYNTDGTIASLSSDNSNITVSVAKTSLETEIQNKSGTSMPTTGGIGTTIFYIVGSVLLLGAVVLLITRRRMRNA